MQSKVVVVVRRSLRFAALGAVFLGGFLLVGMGQFESPTWPTSPGGTSSGESISFGDVVVGQTRSSQYTFKVLESSQAAARVTIYDPCSPFGLSGLTSRSMTLQPGQSITFNVTFTPTEEKSYSCSFKIRAEGGYPVQVKETAVQLSGRGTSGATHDVGPSESPAATVPVFPFGLVPTQPVPTEEGETFEGTTDDQGEFKITMPPATSVVGRLSECEGEPIAGEIVQLRLISDGYGISVLGYQETLAKAVSRFAFFGIEGVDLGGVCLEPTPAIEMEPSGSMKSDELGACPCCSIIVEARMCCNPRDQYVETDTVYEPQLVRIRVAYCEPREELGDVDLAPLPLTNTGGVLVNPGLAPSPASIPDPSQVGVTSITLNGESLFEGDGEFEKAADVGTLKPGTHTVRAIIGRINGEVCVCEKTFEVLACPSVNARLEQTLEPANGYAPVRVTYDLDWPGGMDNICRIWYHDARNIVHSMTQKTAFPFSETYSAIDACIPRPVEPEVNVTANNCCRYDILGEPFAVKPPFLDCLIPDELIPKDVLDLFLDISRNITWPLHVPLVVESLKSVFDQVGQTQGNTTVCSVLLDMQLKGLAMGIYQDFDRLVKGFPSDIAGGVFQRGSNGTDTGPRRWRFYAPSENDNSSAKLVYKPVESGGSPYFELTLLREGCDDCPVLPTYKIVSVLTDIQAERQAADARERLTGTSEASEPAFLAQTFSILLEIGLCCPPPMCDE